LYLFPLLAPFLHGDDYKISRLIVLGFYIQRHFYNFTYNDPAKRAAITDRALYVDLRQLLTPELKRDIMCFTSVFVYVLKMYDEVNSFALTSNPCECYFGLRKLETRGKKNSFEMRTVVEKNIVLTTYMKCDQNYPLIPGRRN